MLVTMKNSALIDQLVSLAGGNIDLVNEAIRVCAKGPDEEADLKEVVDYIVAQRATEPAAA
jgi:phosphotransferase system HPr-like phosphotransfer protein